MALVPGVGRLWSLARKVEDLFQLQEQVRDLVKEIEHRLRFLEDRMIRIEAEQPQVIDQAKNAATAASSPVSGAALNDIVTRLTRAELRIEGLEQGHSDARPPRAPKRLTAAKRPGGRTEKGGSK